MGTAKINGVEHWFEDSEHRLDVQVTSGNVVVNGKILFHAEGLADITVEAFDLVGHHFTFSNVGMPKNVEEDVGTITPHEMKPKSKAKQVGGVLAYNFVDDIGRESRNLQRRTIRKGMNTIMDTAVAALFGKKKRGK